MPDELVNQLTGRQLSDQGCGLTRPDRHERGARLLARQLPKRADEAPLQRELQGLAVGHLGNEPVTQCAGRAAGKGARQLGPVVDGAAQLRAMQRRNGSFGASKKGRAELGPARAQSEGRCESAKDRGKQNGCEKK